jgi:KipI family sensor histidine kinase inhibitor
MPEYRVLSAGDTALVVEFGDHIDRQLSAWVLALARRLNEFRLNGIVEAVPTYRSLIVHFDPQVLSVTSLTGRIVELMRGLKLTAGGGRHWYLPTCYHPDLAPDLDYVAAQTGHSPSQVVELHSATTYHAYMIGFLPGLAYLGDLPAELVLPRRSTPRLKVPAGSVAIATTMTTVYTIENPGGWHLIGRSPVLFWERQPEVRTLLAPGDKVTFSPVSLREYEDLRAKAAAGMLHIEPVDETIEAAA